MNQKTDPEIVYFAHLFWVEFDSMPFVDRYLALKSYIYTMSNSSRKGEKS